MHRLRRPLRLRGRTHELPPLFDLRRTPCELLRTQTLRPLRRTRLRAGPVHTPVDRQSRYRGIRGFLPALHSRLRSSQTLENPPGLHLRPQSPEMESLQQRPSPMGETRAPRPRAAVLRPQLAHARQPCPIDRRMAFTRTQGAYRAGTRASPNHRTPASRTLHA